MNTIMEYTHKDIETMRTAIALVMNRDDVRDELSDDELGAMIRLEAKTKLHKELLDQNVYKKYTDKKSLI